MPRKPDERIEKAREMYLAGSKLKDIAKELGVPEGTVRSWKNRYEWECNVANKKRNVANKTKRRKKAVADEVEAVLQNTDLTDKQQLFCIYYIRSFNAKSDGKGYEEVARGKVIKWDSTRQNSADDLKCTMYDDLYFLQKSQDNFFFQSGIGTKARIDQVLGGWGMSLSKYEGPNKKHGKKKYQNQYLSDIILDILGDSVKKGGSKYIFRQVKGQVQVVKRGGNEDVYVFENRNSILTSHTLSTAGMITRVKIIGKEKKEGKDKVLATLNGSVQYGIRQRIYTRGEDESMADANAAAQAILDEDGDIQDEIMAQAPDVPYIRKGDLVYMKAGGLKKYYYILGIQHNADSCSMTMQLRKKR